MVALFVYFVFCLVCLRLWFYCDESCVGCLSLPVYCLLDAFVWRWFTRIVLCFDCWFLVGCLYCFVFVCWYCLLVISFINCDVDYDMLVLCVIRIVCLVVCLLLLLFDIVCDGCVRLC